MNQKTRPEPVIPKEIVRLLDRRATLGGWLAKLNELRGTVRPEVYEKVRGDYEERLRAQETELAAHRSDMEMALAERRARVLQLEADRDERAAELEEAELRFAVGEFKEGEYEKRKEQHDRTLAQLDAELEADRAALAKLAASEAAMWVSDEAVQVFGGYGYMRDYPVEKLMRDAKGTEIYDGTSEVLRYVVAREILRDARRERH
jgi:alkylation response protein AidB-like acyl-CoA dehydrogenase